MSLRPVSWAVAAPPLEHRPEALDAASTASADAISDETRWNTAVLLTGLAFGVILLLAVGFSFVGLDRQGYGNTYYAAAVQSMLSGWESFFYASFDGGNFISVDKPPLGLWLQVLSAHMFGFSGPSLFLPQALAGVASVVLVFYLVRRVAGAFAALTAALILTVTPINAVTNRNNTMDSVLVLVLMLALWSVSVAAEQGRLRWLLLGSALVGLGYNVKMLQAFPVLPGFFLAYALWAPLSISRRLSHLSLAVLVVVGVSLSWSITVDLTPASNRPYVGSSGSNSALSLALGYNGLGRLYQPPSATAPQPQISGLTIDLTQSPAFAPQIGEPSVVRLFRPGVADEASWLLVLALVGLVAGLIEFHSGRAPDVGFVERRMIRIALTLWGGWLLAWVGYFSIARFYHLYYLVMLGPAVAALTGIGIASTWRAYVGGGWRATVLPIALIACAAVQVWMLAPYGTWNSWLEPSILGLSLVAAAGLFVFHSRSAVGAAFATAIGVLALCMTPALWTITAIQDGKGGDWLPETGPPMSFANGGNRGQGARAPGNNTVGFGNAGPPAGQTANPPNAASGGRDSPNGQRGGPPVGGPGGGQGSAQPGSGPLGGPGAGPPGGGPGGGRGGAMTFAGAQWNNLDQRLVDYLMANQGDSRFLVATTSSSYASVFMLASGEPTMALGGYQGWDRVLSREQLAMLVDKGAVRFFYLQQQNGFGRGPLSLDATADLVSWVRESCAAVPAEIWSEPASADSRFQRQSRGLGRDGLQLYRCDMTGG